MLALLIDQLEKDYGNITSVVSRRRMSVEIGRLRVFPEAARSWHGYFQKCGWVVTKLPYYQRAGADQDGTGAISSFYLAEGRTFHVIDLKLDGNKIS